ncbi:MAG: response regulator transcription factor [Bacteroidetes bacterium]|nr:response regulator transcription factor [Bacteroidota bacterium]
MMKVKVLYIEDEPFLGRIVSETLEQQGFDLKLITDGARVIDCVTSYEPDVCVLDIMLPNVDGFTLCYQIRALKPTLPIIFLTALSETSDLVKGFDAGGTDYIKKPFSIEELIARINNQLNLLSNRLNNNTEIQSLGRYKLNRARYQLISPTTTSKLSGREMEIISLLANNINRIVDRKDILTKVWGDDSFFNSRTLDVYVRKLRAMFSEDPDIEIVTLKGKGYLFMLK